MAISYVGGQVAGRAGIASTATITFALTGGTNATPQAGDLVIITAVVGSAARNPAQAISGYTALGQLNPNTTTYDTSMNVSWKFMGSTPDTTFTLPSTGNIADAQRYTIQVFRDVDTTTPMDVTPVSATGTATGRPNPGSITPTTSGAWVVICGGGAAATGAAYVAPANYTTGFLTGFTADTNDAMVGSGYRAWTSGAEDPAAYTGGTANAVDSWAAYTIALRPANLGNTPIVLPASAVDSGIGVSFVELPTGWQVGDYLVAALESSGSESIGIDAAWPGWTQIAVADSGTTGIGSARLRLMGKFAATGETRPDTTTPTDHVLTTMIGFRGVNTTTPVELSSSGGSGTAGTSVTLTSPGTTAGADRILATFVASGIDSAATTTYSLWNNANASLVERKDDGTAAGVGGTIGIATGRLPTAGVVGNADVTQTSSQYVWIALVIQPAGVVTHTTTGTLTGPGSTIAGASAHTGSFVTHTTTGVLTGPGSTIAGAANNFTVHPTSGVLTGPGSTIAGASARFVTHPTSGVLTGPGSTIAGAANNFTVHPTTGVLTGPGSTIAGSSAHSAPGPVTHTTTGTLTGPGSTIAGAANRFVTHPTSGVLTGPGSTIAGAANNFTVHPTTGVLTGPGSTIAGTANNFTVHPTSGVLTGPGSTIAGAAAHYTLHTTTGALTGPGSTLAGASGHTGASSTPPRPDGYMLIGGVPVLTYDMYVLVGGSPRMITAGYALIGGVVTLVYFKDYMLREDSGYMLREDGSRFMHG